MWRELIQQYPEGVMVILVLLSLAVLASVHGATKKARAKNLIGRAVLNVYYRGDTLILSRAGTIRSVQHGLVLCRDVETTQEWTVPLDALEPIDGGLGLLWVTDGPFVRANPNNDPSGYGYHAPDQFERTKHDLGGGRVLVHKQVRDYCPECDRRNSPGYVPGKGEA